MSCSEKTKKGEKCNRACQGRSKYCWQHKKKKPTKRPLPKKKEQQKSKLYNPKQAKFCRCLASVKAKQSGVNPWAVCSSTVGRTSIHCKQYGV
ncbi:MAG TPA: hypothetical protein VLG50_05500 [Candidatus Saccharimonadales bacterium]|nr:hypothetical protein [Candidatus Saccharimonadales bacterium]